MNEVITKKKSFERSGLASNAMSMYCLQLANYGLPLVTLPYLIRVLGAEHYGVLAAAQATMFLFVFFVDAGFNTRAVRLLANPDISLQRTETILAATQWIKLAFSLLAVASVALLISLGVWSDYTEIYLASTLLIAGSLFFPAWIFQGLENMKFTLICNVLGRALTVLAIVCLVKSPDDLLTATVLQSSATLVSGLFSFAALKNLGISLIRPTVRSVWTEIRQAIVDVKHLGPSEFVHAVVTNGSVFVISLFISNHSLGVYAALEKIARAAVNIFQPMLKVLYPRMSGLWLAGNSSNYYREIDKWLKIIVFAAVVYLGISWLFASTILELLFGATWSQYTVILRGLLFWAFLFVISNAISYLVFLATGRSTLYARILLSTGLLQLLLVIVAALFQSIQGVVTALVVAELIKVLAMFLSSKLFTNKGCNANS